MTHGRGGLAGWVTRHPRIVLAITLAVIVVADRVVR